jgi:phenylacetate-CoA ligase
MNISTISYATRVLQKFVFYIRSQKWNRKTIEEYQDRMLIKVVKHAAQNVLYYHNLFRKIKFNPNEFRGRADMHKIPLLDKEILRTRQNEFVAENADKYGINWDSTSGSTGTPLHLIIDNSTKAHKLAAVLRSYQWAGYSPWEKTFSIQSYTFDNPDDISKHYRFVNLWRFNSKLLSKDTAIEVVEMINNIKPKIFIGYPFSILMLSRFAKEQGLSIHPPESIVTAGETLSDQRRKLLEDAYKCKVFDFFSLHEDVAIMTECSYQTKHLYEDFAYNEIVDDHGQDASTRGIGELVGTGFYNYAMPLIRYRIGDIVRIDAGDQSCRCGRQFKVVKEIIGRQNDYLETPDGRFLGNVLEHAIDNSKGVVLSQCVQDAVDHVYLNLIIDDTFNDDSKVEMEEGLRARLGSEIKIDFKIVTELEKNKSGKTPFIMSKIGHEYI